MTSGNEIGVQLIDAPARALTPAEHLAIDEALLDRGGSCLRFWELSDPTVVLGRSSRIDREVDLAFCRSFSPRPMDVLRRCSGGLTIVGGPGCLMYSVVLSIDQWPHLVKIDAAHDEVMSRVAAAAARQIEGVTIRGVCDLTVSDPRRGQMKCGGNALRVTRDAVLYHGTVLYDFDLDLISRCLKRPPRQPDYRGDRPHREFVCNVPIDPRQFELDLANQFGAVADPAFVADLPPSGDFPPIADLLRDRYHNPSWHHRH